MEGKEQCHVEISKMLRALEDLVAEVDISSDRETITEYINNSAEGNVSYYEVKKHKPWFDGRYQNYFIKEANKTTLFAESK
jgi:predicted metallo-beta-lactamase superfamily hydrolase